MGKLYSLISALLLTVSATFAASPDSYEWWFDNDVSSAQTGPVSGSAIDLQIDTSDLPKGLHYFNFRLAEGDSIYGSIYRKPFHTIGPDDAAISYEYWYDYDYASKVSGAIAVGSNHLELDVATLPQGSHYFNMRLGYGDGKWGSVYRKMVLHLAGTVDVVAYEYWIDNDYSAKAAGTLSEGANIYEIDLEGLRKGLHRFSYRLQTGTGVWGAPYTKYFYCTSNDARFTEYEYWLDNDYAARISGNATSNPVSFEVDLSNFDKSGGAHYFNLRTRDGDGDWSPTYRRLIVFSDNEKRRPIIGYNHFLNGESLGYVEVERQFVDNYMFEVNLPDTVYPSLANRRPTFDGDRVYIAGTDTVEYTMQIKTEFGWAAPQNWDIGISNDFETTAVGMKVNTQQTFAAPTDLQFVAVKFTASGTPLYFRSDAAVALDIYKEGERVGSFTPDQVKGMAMTDLEAGEYFGVLHSMADKKAENFTLHLMDTPNMVPMPRIEYANETVTITCSRDDALIRYTLDGKDPTEESTLYEKEFTLNHNAMVKAKAWVAGSDILPSEVAEYTVDSYKVATPTGEFNAETRQLTLLCATEDAKIFYTFNLDEGWTPYSDPIAISKNCIVYAKASRDGYHDSEVAEYTIDSYKVATPTGEFDSQTRKLTLLCETEDAKIFYALTDGGAWTVYSTPITIDGNRTVYAKATLDGYNDSDVAEIVVSDVKCSPVSIDYNGRYVTLTSGDSGASIRYSTDGSNPSSGTEYSGTFDVKGVCLLRAVALKAGYMNSDIAELPIDRYADNEHAETAAEGLLSSAFEWDISLPDTISTFRVEGRLNDADYAFLHSMAGLRHLDIRNVAEASIPDRTFSGSRLVSISLPSDLQEYGDSIFSGSSRLSSVLWNSKTLAPEERLMDGLSNPNLLLYVPAETDFTGYNGVTVVKGGHAETVEIHYGYPYYAAEDFRADHVSIAREFRETTEVETCRGWETIVLPFAPTEITHEVNGAAVPFAAWDGDTDGMKPFWLYSSVSDGWEEASSIEACVPYIISMPNNVDYVPSFNLAGLITFSADNVDLGPETSVALSTRWKESTEFEGTFMPVEEDGLLSLNVNANGGELLPGSAFVTNDVTVPFGAYVRGASGRKAMPVFGDSNGVDMPTLGDAGLVIETPAPGMLRISSGRERRVAVITTTGVTVRTLSLHPGETVTIEGLTRDLYIVGGVKVMVK